jgi:hypothetical protein
VIAFSDVSPVGVIQKLPRMPFVTRVPNNLRVTDVRVPSERAIASSRTSIAWAELRAKLVGFVPNLFENDAA